MSLSSRFLRRSVLCLLSMMTGLCAAQVTQFQSVPEVQPTGGRVTSFLIGSFQKQSTRPDFLYVNAPVGSGTASTITAGAELIGLVGQGFSSPAGNQIPFNNVSNVAAAIGDFDGDGLLDFAFALTPSGSTTTNLCVYYGTGATAASQNSSFNGGGAYPAQGTSGCMTFAANATVPPNFTYIAAMPLQTVTGSKPQILVEDSANSLLYVISNSGTTGSNGVLSGFKVANTIVLSDGAGPIYSGDFNGDGKMDFIVNGQTGNSATVYLGNGDGTFKPPVRYAFDDGVRSMLVQDMDLDGHADMVVETNHGVIEIHKGNTDGTFTQASEGGTQAMPNGLVVPGSVAGNGGRLAAINPRTLDILTTTPIGMSLLRSSGGLNYSVITIYNIGSGRASFALADIYGAHNLDLVVDSAEGVALIAGNPDGTFKTCRAYTALAPGLGAVVGQFRIAKYNPTGVADVVVATGATQAQLLQGNGDGTFAPIATTVNPSGGPGNVPGGTWSTPLSGDFDGDGNLDILYAMTGLPASPPGSNFPILYTQYGNGDGTFSQSGFAFSSGGSYGAYGGAAVGDFNGDGISDVGMSNAFIDADGLGATNIRNAYQAALSQPDSFNTSFSQVAGGFFKTGRSKNQDIVFEQGSSFIPYLNSQDGTGKNFTQEPAVVGPGGLVYPSTVLLTDVDGDGNGDLVVVYYNTAPNPVGAGPVSPYQVYIWWGNGDGTFTQTPLVLNLSRNYYLGAVKDMNGDGYPDLVLSDGSLISILYGQSKRSFGTVSPATGLYTGEQHFLAGQGINSISLADVNGDGFPDVVVANGGLTISNALAIGGKTLASISLTPNPTDISTGGITVLLNRITTEPVTGTLVATPEPSLFSAAFKMTATLTPSPGVAPPTGTVQFYLDGNTVGSPVTLTQGTTSSSASYNVAAGNTYAGGVHAMTAYYSGDTVNTQATISGAVGTHLIQGGATTSTILMCIGPTAACPAPPGVPSPQPTYSPALSMYYGQIWNGFIQVTANDGSALTGNLELLDAYTGVAVAPPTPLCTIPVGGGACPVSVGTTQGTSVGVNVLTAYYPGDGTHTASTSNPTAITVLPDLTSATLTGSPNPATALQLVTFTATVAGNYAAPTGPIAFFYGSTLLGQVSLVPSASGNTSTATVTTSVLPVGSDVITLNYGATTNFAAASASFTEVITPSLAGSFTVTVTPTPVSVGVGYSTLFTVTVTPQGGFTQGVNLSCANLPTETTCYFGNAQITGGSGTTNLVVATTAPHSCSTSQPYFVGANGGGPGAAPFALPAIAGLLAIFLPGRRRWLRALLALVLVAGAMQMTGCGNCTDLGTRPATYTFQVTGAATGTSEVEAQTVTITVTI